MSVARFIAETAGSPASSMLPPTGWQHAMTLANILAGRKPKRRKGLTKQDKKAPKFPDLLRRDF
ncbi:MAG: hypothetical protein ACLP9Y_20115 [Mycobacterium sp.]